MKLRNASRGGVLRGLVLRGGQISHTPTPSNHMTSLISLPTDGLLIIMRSHFQPPPHPPTHPLNHPEKAHRQKSNIDQLTPWAGFYPSYAIGPGCEGGGLGAIGFLKGFPSVRVRAIINTFLVLISLFSFLPQGALIWSTYGDFVSHLLFSPLHTPSVGWQPSLRDYFNAKSKGVVLMVHSLNFKRVLCIGFVNSIYIVLGFPRYFS